MGTLRQAGNGIMQFQLKPISKAAVGEALEKAKRYRLLNEPSLAESIVWTSSKWKRTTSGPW